LGRLAIYSEPDGASIVLNGETTAYRTPVNFSLPAGRHQITIEREGFAPITQEIVVEADRASVLRLGLDRPSDRGILSRIPFVR
jgi:hypothetical protein